MRDLALQERTVGRLLAAKAEIHGERVGIVVSLPKTDTYKLAKYRLRATSLEEYRSLWDRESHGIQVPRPASPIAGGSE